MAEDAFIDYYALLCIACDATVEHIKKAYKKLALKKHPDRNPNNPNAGDEFAVLVEAKEILTNQQSRNKYDVQYRIYQKQLKQHELDRIKAAKMGQIRKDQIRKLEQAEERARNKNHSEGYKHRIYKAKQNAVKEELEKFRKLIEEQKEEQYLQKINKLKQLKEEQRMKKKEKKLQKKSLIVKMDKKQTNKAYTRNEIESIFKIYGKIIDIHMINNDKCVGAEIIFAKSKYVLKALNDEQELNNEFDLTLIVYDEKKKSEASEMNKEEKWRQLVKNRQHLTHKEYQQLVWKKLEQLIQDKRNVDELENDTADIMDID